MKKNQKLFFISILTIIGCTTFSCNRNTKTESVSKNNYNTIDSLHINQENPTIKEFRAYVDTLDSTDATSAFLATEKFKIIFAGQSKGICDTAFVFFQHLADTLLVKLNEKLDNDTTDYEAFMAGVKSTKQIVDFRNSLLKNGFLLRTSEGIVYIDLNYDFIIKNFSNYVSESLNAYLIEIRLENKEGFAQNDAIVISPEKHVDRIIWYENFISQNPNFVMIENCKKYRKAYFTYLLSGYNNSPLYSNSEKNELSSYYTKAYEYLLKKYPTSETAVLIQPYYEAIKQNQQVVANDLLKKYMIRGLIFNQN